MTCATDNELAQPRKQTPHHDILRSLVAILARQAAREDVAALRAQKQEGM